MEYTIYGIYCKDENIKDCYIGSTNNLSKRIIEHSKKCYNSNSNKYNYKLYKFIRENGEFNNWDFVELEKVDEENRLIRERYWIEKFNGTLNVVIPTQTPNEWYKKYYEKKKDIITIKHKEYYDNNANELLEQKKEYYKINKDKIKNRNNERYTCECGGIYTYQNKTKHCQTKKHLTYLSCHQEQDEGHTDIVALEV
jgi:hypothetical protein